MKKLIVSLCLLALPLAFAGCGAKTETPAPAPTETATAETPAPENEQDQTTISIIGSTTIQPIAQSIADEFAVVEPNIAVEIQGVGSSAGIKAAIDGTADIGAASREIKEEEKASGITEHIVAYDGIAVVVNSANTVTDLTKEQIKKIFSGEMKNWSEVGGNDADIIVVSRESGSGTRDAFEELVELTEEVDGKKMPLLREDALISDGNGAVKANVASKENSIAYLSLGYVDETMKAVSVDGVTPTIETVKSAEYKISRPLILVTSGDVKPEVQKYLDYFMSDAGQEIVSEKYISIK